jgi:hypothetical protein
MRNRILAFTTMLLLCAAPSAFALGKGTSMLALQLTTGTADLYDPSGLTTTGYIGAYDHSEGGLGIEYWNMMGDDYAFAIGINFGSFMETDQPGQGAAPGSPDLEYSQSSFSVRIGGDRVVKVGERAVFYFGPGFQYWNGNATFDGFGGPGTSVETESVTRFGLDGRIGATMMIGTGWGFTFQTGHRIAYASAEQDGAKATWTPSSNYSNGGLLFTFGGK